MNQFILKPVGIPFGLEARCSHCRMIVREGSVVILVGQLDRFLGIVEEVSQCGNCNHSNTHLRLLPALDEAKLYLDQIQRQVEASEVRVMEGAALEDALRVLRLTPESAHRIVLSRLEEN